MQYTPSYLNKTKQPSIELTDLQQLVPSSVEALVRLSQNPDFGILLSLFAKKESDLKEGVFKTLPYNEFAHGSAIGQVDLMNWIKDIGVKANAAKLTQIENKKINLQIIK